METVQNLFWRSIDNSWPLIHRKHFCQRAQPAEGSTLTKWWMSSLFPATNLAQTHTQKKKSANKLGVTFFFFFFFLRKETRFLIFSLSMTFKNHRQQARTGLPQRPELTIFWEFYFTEGERTWRKSKTGRKKTQKTNEGKQTGRKVETCANTNPLLSSNWLPLNLQHLISKTDLQVGVFTQTVFFYLEF